MIMIPLPFIIAMASLLIFFNVWMDNQSGQRKHWLLWFLLALAFQEVLIGVRFGYNIEWLRKIQPVTAALLPPLAYFGFSRPTISIGITGASIPIIITLLILRVNQDVIDGFLACNNLIFATLLIRHGRNGGDNLAWVRIGQIRKVLALLWFTIVVLIASALTDAAIWYDFITNKGAHTTGIPSLASLLGIFLLVSIGSFVVRWKSNALGKSPPHNSVRDKRVFAQLENTVHKGKLYLDPDISLNRIARRMTLPARDVSRAINSQSGKSVSQYINMLRVKEACRLLKNTDLQITQSLFRK